MSNIRTPGATAPRHESPGARRRKQVFPSMPHYPTWVRPVTASLRDAAGAWPAAVWLAVATSWPSAGRAAHPAAASRWRPRVAWAPARSRQWPLPAACATGRRRRVACSSTSALWRQSALVSYASIGWSLTPQTSYGDANRWLVAAAAAACGVLLANLLRRPLESAIWVLCAAALPLVAYAIQQRAHGVFFQTSPRLQGVLGYPNAIGAYAALAAPGALWLASSRAARPARGGLRDALAARPRARAGVFARRAARGDHRLCGVPGRERAQNGDRGGGASPCSS